MAKDGKIKGSDIFEGVYEEIAKSNTEMKDFLNTFGQFIKAAQNFKTARSGNTITKNATVEEERFNIAMKERLGIMKKVTVQEERNKLLSRKVAENLAAERFEAQKLNQINKQRAILTSKYADAYDKLGVRVAKAKRELKNLIITEGDLSNKTKKARIEFERLNAKIRQADNVAGDFQRNVGNYKSALSGMTGVVRGLIGAFGVIEGIRLGARLVKDSIELARAAKGVEFAYNRIGEAGVKAFNNIQKSTRGLLSELDIKKSIVEFDNFNLNLAEAGTLFEFVALRASQTGKSVEYLRDSLVEGLSKESLLRLDNLGVSAIDLRREMNELGLSVTEAFAKLAKQEIAEAGGQLEEASNGAERFAAGMENVQLAFGQIFTSIKGLGLVNDAVGYWNTSLKLTNELVFKQGDLLGILKVRYNDLTASGREQNRQLLDEIENRTLNAKAIEEEAKAFIKRNNSQAPLPKGQNPQNDQFGVFANYSEPIRDVETLNKLIAAQEEKKLGLTKADGARRDVIKSNIEALKKERDAILGVTKAIKDTTDKTPQVEKVLDSLTAEFKQSENILKAFKKVLPDIFDFSTLSTDEYEKLLVDVVQVTKVAGQDLEKIFSGVFDTFEGFYGLDLTAFKTFLTDKTISADDAASALKSISGAIFDSEIIRYDNQIVANQERLDLILNDENASEEKKKQAQLESDKEVKKIRLKQAKAERRNVLTQIAIDTAAGVAKALAQTGVLAPLTIPTILGIGLAQAAFVASQELPKFFKGTQNAPGGLAWTDERGAEIHTDKHGRVKDWGSDKGARIKMMEKGDKIFTADKSEDILKNIVLPDGNILQSVSKKLNKDTTERTNWMQTTLNIEPLRSVISEEIKQGFKNIKITNVNNNNFTPKTTGIRV